MGPGVLTTAKVLEGPVTPLEESVSAAIPITDQVELQGFINAVDPQSNLVTISIGSADGVRQGMVFHVTRGDTFVCNLRITDVDSEISAGTMEIVVSQPRRGDRISTGW